MGHRGYEDVIDAGTAGEVWPRRSDGPRSDRGWLRSALPEVRDYGTGSGNAGRSTTSAVGVGAAGSEKVALSCSC